MSRVVGIPNVQLPGKDPIGIQQFLQSVDHDFISRNGIVLRAVVAGNNKFSSAADLLQVRS